MKKIIKSAIPQTIGELKSFISDYPDSTPFGFINQPIQELVETDFDGETFVSFAEIHHFKSRL